MAEGQHSAKKIVQVDLQVRSRPTILTTDIAEQVVKEASYLSLAHACVCRVEHGCQNYSRDMGCLYLGEGAKGIVAKGNAVEIAVDKGLDVIRQAREKGLVHMILWTSRELRDLGGNAEHALELCSCCPCCCISRRTGDGMQAYIDGITGLSIARASEGCSSCHECEQACYFKAIRIGDEGPEINLDRCKGCGLCVTACSAGVLSVEPLGQVPTYADGWKMTDARAYMDEIIRTIR